MNPPHREHDLFPMKLGPWPPTVYYEDGRVQTVTDGAEPVFWQQVRREYLDRPAEPPEILELVRIVLYWPGHGIIDHDGFHLINPPGTRKRYTIPSLIKLAKVYEEPSAIAWLKGRGIRVRDDGQVVVRAPGRGQERRLAYAIAEDLFDYLLPLYCAAWRDASDTPTPLLRQIQRLMYPYYPPLQLEPLRSAIKRGRNA